MIFNNIDRSTGDQREFLIESPEPPGDAILASYLEGLYRFRGRTCEGERFESTDPLSHDLPVAAVITSCVVGRRRPAVARSARVGRTRAAAMASPMARRRASPAARGK